MYPLLVVKNEVSTVKNYSVCITRHSAVGEDHGVSGNRKISDVKKNAFRCRSLMPLGALLPQSSSSRPITISSVRRTWYTTHVLIFIWFTLRWGFQRGYIMCLHTHTHTSYFICNSMSVVRMLWWARSRITPHTRARALSVAQINYFT